MAKQDLWKQRFFLYTGLRMVGLALFLVGIAIAYSNLLRPGGLPQLGAGVAIIGAVGDMFAPRLLKRKWKRENP